MITLKNCPKLLVLAALALATCQSPAPHGPPSPPEGEWHDNKFSMFIHWGLYSELGGVWNGQPVTRGYSEQIQAHAGIYSDVYERVAERFNPLEWDPDHVVSLAKQAGMRSVVITAKHHDGFCMFGSDYTDFNIVDATPYGRDVIGELAEACARHGLNFGLYFSLIDWHYPPAYPISSHNADFIPPEHHRYNMNQVRELLTRYGPVSELWFDMGSLEPSQSRELRELVHSLQPDCMVSGRLGNDMGDFTVMGDNEYPDYTLDIQWQTPASMFDETWGYRSWQERGDHTARTREKIEKLVRVVSHGGNYLLNIGPRGDGSIVKFEKEVLLGIGRWLDANGEAIYGTRASGLEEPHTWGTTTAKDGNLYLHLLNPPSDGIITIPGIGDTPSSCFILDDPGLTPEYYQTTDGLTIILPPGGDFSDIRVIKLEFDEGFTLSAAISLPFQEDTVILDRRNSHNHYSFSGVDYYSSFRSTVRRSWTPPGGLTGNFSGAILFSEAEKGRTIELATPGGIQLLTLEGGKEVPVRKDQTGVQAGPLYLNGPHISRIDRINGMEGTVDVSLPWPGTRGREWTRAGAGAGEMLKRPAGRNTCWYAWQEINSEDGGGLLVRFVRGDGVQVFLNGIEIYVHNDPLKTGRVEEILHLHLEKGRNELLVKFYNRFGTEMEFSVDHNIPQVLYRKQIEDITLPGKGSLSWYPHSPVSPHTNMAMPNLSLELVRTGN